MTLSKLFAGLGSLSKLGTPYADVLPKILSGGPLPNGYPWGTKTALNTNPYLDRPETGVTRYYDWTITKETASPDGVANQLLLVNGEFPGPLLEANWGDWVQVTVHNNLTDEGTAIHWHGQLQQETPWMDGVPGVTQCPIAPGSTFTYKFKPDLYGSAWYHSHYEAQYASGLLGPMVIHGPQTSPYDIDVGPVVVHDYYHTYYLENEKKIFAATPIAPTSDNNLINGKNSYNGNDAPLASFNFTSSKKMLLRLINTSAFAVQKITIDNHNMTVIANDFVPLNPYTTDLITLAPGQRTDVIVQALPNAKGAYWLRTYKTPSCSPSKPGNYEAKAAIFYENADRSVQPRSTAGANAYNNYCGNDALNKTVPLFPIAPEKTPGFTEIIPLAYRSNGTDNVWYMQNRTARENFNDPMLLDVNQKDLDFDYIRNVHNYGSNSSLRFVIENFGAQPHPMHLHGHNFWVLQEGTCTASQLPAELTAGDVSANGVAKSSRLRMRSVDDFAVEKRTLSLKAVLSNLLKWTSGNDNSANSGKTVVNDNHGHCWDGSIVNPSNPQRRDVQMLLPGHYVVLQWNQDNPGLWPLHCHIAWHLSAGFVWMVLEQPSAVAKMNQISSAVGQTCNDWAAWSNRNIVDQIDDGI